MNINHLIRKPALTFNPMVAYTITNSKTGEERHVFNDPGNWEEFEIGQDRDGTTGVMATSSMPLVLHREDRLFVKYMYDADGIYAKGVLKIYKRDAENIDDFQLVSELDLDFSSYLDNHSRDRLEISTQAAELNDFLNSLGRTKYDIPVSELLPEKWRYNRMNMMNVVDYTSTEYPYPGSYFPTSSTFTASLFLNMNSSERVPGGPEHDFRTQYGKDKVDGSEYFFRAAETVTLTIEINLSVQRAISTTGGFLQVGFFKNGQFSDEYNSWISYGGPAWINETIDILLEGGDILTFGARGEGGADGRASDLIMNQFNAFRVSYTEKGTPVDIDVVRPLVLCQKLLDLITGTSGQYTCEINWGELDYDPMLAAGESIRGFDDAILHTSVDDFLEFMRYYGYEYYTEGRKLIYKLRDDLFPESVSLSLSSDEVADVVCKADVTFVHPSIRIGYPTQDYESPNGAFEVNGTYEYTTGYQNAKNKNTMEWIIPYRADSIGIELLCWKRSQVTTDRKDDNDVFLIAMDKTPVSGNRAEYREITIEVSPTITLFNAPLNPYFLIKRNESYIGITAIGGTVQFTATESYKRSAVITGGINPRADHFISKRLFDPEVYVIKVGSWQMLPPKEIRNGLIMFGDNGVSRYGYIKNTTKNYAKEAPYSWELYVKSLD